jgi:hypothetical protein
MKIKIHRPHILCSKNQLLHAQFCIPNLLVFPVRCSPVFFQALFIYDHWNIYTNRHWISVVMCADCQHSATFECLYTHPAGCSVLVHFCQLLFSRTNAVPVYGLSSVKEVSRNIIFAREMRVKSCTHTPSDRNIHTCVLHAFKRIYSIFHVVQNVDHKKYLPWLTV